MLIDKYKKRFLDIEDIYFADSLQNSNSVIVRYFQYKKQVKNYNKEFNANIIDLNIGMEDIKKELKKIIKS